jgi:hypothetical protein
MMFDCNYNASIDNGGTDLVAYKGIANHGVVSTFIARSKRRYEQLAETSTSYWDWAVDLLEKIEVTHRGDIDTFKPECRAFRDLKAMEFYGAFYLVNYSIEADWKEKISDSKHPNGKSWQGDERWTRCWQLAMEMPTRYYIEEKLQTAIAKVLAPPPSNQTRPCEWMWIAWVNRLEQNETAIKRNLNRIRNSDEVIADFRKPFKELIDAKYSTALTLQYSAERDAPNLELKHPNQTEKGWYRRIPDVGECTKFRRDKSDLITISQFWMRKFVVTLKDYHLFDPKHRHDHSFKGDDLPVTGVDWFSATMFCYWLGPGYHLPTEAQFETACRANQLTGGELQDETDFWFGNKKADSIKHAWIDVNSNGRPHSLQESLDEKNHQNRFGLFDMAGNVWEWCSDWYSDKYVKNEVNDPKGPAEGQYRVNRGGCYSLEAAVCGSAYRANRTAKASFSTLGFRVVLSSSGIPK